MAATILDGNKIRDQIKAELAVEIHDLKSAGITPDWQRFWWVRILPRKSTCAPR